MPIQCEWALEGHVIRLLWTGDVTEQEVLELDKQLIAYFDSTDALLVHVISDNSTIGTEPAPKFYLKCNFLRHQRLGWWLSLRDVNTSRLNINLVGQLLKMRYRVFIAEAEAWDYLSRVDASIATSTV